MLLFLVPIMMRILARWESIPQKTGVKLSLMDRFFLFQVVVRASCTLNQTAYENTLGRLSDCHIFVWYLPNIIADRLSGVSSLLADNLPKSSTFLR